MLSTRAFIMSTGAILAMVLGWGGAALAAPIFEQTDLFVGGQGGYASYRIPAMTVMPSGTIVALAEGRKTSASDSGDIDLVMRRSTDGGRTWSAMQVVYEEGGAAPITIGNPTPVVDRATGKLHLLFSRNNQRLFITSSSDDGATFSPPTEITGVAEDFNFEWTRLGPGPTAGIQTTSGRLVVPVWLNETLGDPDEYRVGALVSDDHGQTWQAGSVVPVDADPTIRGLNESAVVQLADGSLLLSERTSAGTPGRARSTSANAGMSWTPAARDATINPQMTMVKTSIARYSLAAGGGKNRILYSAPAASDRRRATVWLSEDEAATWPTRREIYAGPSGYSELAVTANKTILLAYENGVSDYRERITLARFNLEWLTGVSPLPGDANSDGVVDDADASTLAAHWGEADATWATGDFNDDGQVNAADASILAAHWQQTSHEHSTAAPEPGHITFALTVLPLLIWKLAGRTFAPAAASP